MSGTAKKNFDQFRIRLDGEDSRKKRVDAALRLLEENYLTSEDAEVVEKENRDPDETEDRFRKISSAIKNKGGRDQRLDEILSLLETARIDSRDAVRLKRKKLRRSVFLNFMSGLILLILAVLIIVYDPPYYLKGPTVFKFNVNDGVTVSDLVALAMIGLANYNLIAGYYSVSKLRGYD